MTYFFDVMGHAFSHLFRCASISLQIRNERLKSSFILFQKTWPKEVDTEEGWKPKRCFLAAHNKNNGETKVEISLYALLLFYILLEKNNINIQWMVLSLGYLFYFSCLNLIYGNLEWKETCYLHILCNVVAHFRLDFKPLCIICT